MLTLTIVLIFVSLSKNVLSDTFLHPLSDEFIDHVNNVQSLWTAGRNFHSNISMEYIKKLPGVIRKDHQWPLNSEESNVELPDAELPEYFDAREKWTYCKSLNEIRDQGACSSSWAISPAATYTDHICIRSEGKEELHVSAIDIITCNVYGGTCKSGHSIYAWSNFMYMGVVTGGNYNSSTGCKPYPYRNCNHYEIGNNGYPNCSDVHEKEETCKKQCVSKDIDYFDKKIMEMFSYATYSDMRKVLYTYGPLQTNLNVYSDFLSYKKGVYKHTAGKFLGVQAVKIIGWGVENGVKYWLMANTWNEQWGDKGFFKIIRGINHCNIERYVAYPIIRK